MMYCNLHYIVTLLVFMIFTLKVRITIE